MAGIFTRTWSRVAKGIVDAAGLLSVPFRQGGPGGRSLSMAGMQMSADDALRATAVSACVRLIAGNVAKLPAPVYRRRGEDRKRDRNHPVDRLLNERPNSWQDPFEFRRQMTANVALHGNAYALKRFEGSTISELIPLDPTRMAVTQRDFDLPPVYAYSHKSGVVTPYAASELFHLRDLTLDGVVGLSRIEQAAQGITLTLAAETYGTSFFLNGAEPGVVVSVPNKLNPEQREALLQSWKATHGGPDRAHAPFVMEGGATIDKTTATNRESQMIELRGFQVEDIARMYGLPASMIGRSEKQSNYGTGVEQAALGFLKFHLLDWLVMWESAVKRDLIDDGAFMEHVVEGLLRADFKTRMEGYQIAIQNGILNPDEVRMLENRAKRKDGKGGEYWRPSNMTGADEPVAPVNAPVVPARMPSDRPEHAWRTKIKTALRVVGGNRGA